jgi:KUP system potassium uptake protein
VEKNDSFYTKIQETRDSVFFQWMNMQQDNKIRAAVVLSALGVVYGDIGTSPLYALKESFHHMHEVAVIQSNILGVLSLIFWSLILIISLKYNLLILKADNKGEGGILALTALVSTIFKKSSKRLRVLTLLGLFGTALLYGDGMITPAISVLSAVEGLELVQPALHPYIVPLTVLILIGLFSIQKHGTAVVGKVFGPITLLWFITIGTLGFLKIIDSPEILSALNPMYAFDFFAANGTKAIIVLGSVFLVVTGGEALYSDLGHFGRRPVNVAWFSIVLPCLLLNYFGQGALLLENPAAIKNPFFLLAPSWMLLPLVILATISTVIASQALITGVFSLTMQAVQLQYFPRIKISHTSQTEIGQIYVGSMNFILMICCIALVVSFRSSTALAAAYGIAVTTTMVLTTILFYFVARYSWKWSNFIAMPLCGFFISIEMCFFGGNVLKIVHGGWFPIVIGFLIFTVMSTWKKGRKILADRMLERITPINEIVTRLTDEKIPRNLGVGVYLVAQPQFVPLALLKNLSHFNSLHETVLLVSVKTEEVPFLDDKNRSRIKDVGQGIYKVHLEYGFMEIPDVPKALSSIELTDGQKISLPDVTYFIEQEHVMAKHKSGMAMWRERFFALMTRNSQSAAIFFNLPTEQVMTVGSIVEI